VEVRVAEFCSTAYEERVMELNCWGGSVTRTVMSESAVLGSVWEGCGVCLVRGLEAVRFLGWSQRFCLGR
jgi:hypothetical protein